MARRSYRGMDTAEAHCTHTAPHHSNIARVTAGHTPSQFTFNWQLDFSLLRYWFEPKKPYTIVLKNNSHNATLGRIPPVWLARQRPRPAHYYHLYLNSADPNDEVGQGSINEPKVRWY